MMTAAALKVPPNEKTSLMPSPNSSAVSLDRRHTVATELYAYGTDRASLHRILSHPLHYSQFLAFAKRQYAAENVLFYKRVTALNAMIKAIKRHAVLFTTHILPAEIRNEIHAIYDEFIGEHGHAQINISNSVRQGIEQRFGKRRAVQVDGLAITSIRSLTGDVFEPAKEEVFDMMFYNLYPLFLKERKEKEQVEEKAKPSGVFTKLVRKISLRH
jgi:hypothetical protein